MLAAGGHDAARRRRRDAVSGVRPASAIKVFRALAAARTARRGLPWAGAARR